jgi:choline-glycine betaine transporter
MPAAARDAMVVPIRQRGLHAWSISGICVPPIACFTFRRRQASEFSKPIPLPFEGSPGASPDHAGERAPDAGLRP